MRPRRDDLVRAKIPNTSQEADLALKGSKTEQHLKDAFAGESQANRRYLYFANKADIEGYADVAALFRSTDGGQNWQELPGLRCHGTGAKWQPGAGGIGGERIVARIAPLVELDDGERPDDLFPRA